MLKKFLSDTKKYLAYSGISAKAQLKAEVANSYLNWIWWVLEPVCFTFIYYLVFGIFFNLNEEYMISFIVIGVSLWDFFSRMMKNSVNIIRSNKSIISKVYLPKHILILVRLCVNGFKMLITLAIGIVTLIILQVEISWRVILAVPILAVFLIFNFGLSCILLHFGVYVADLNHIVEIVLRMVFYLTGVFYSVPKKIPEPFGLYAVNINPVAYCVDALRKVLLYKETPNLWILLVWLILSLLLSAVGVRIVYKNENSYVKSI